MATFGCILGIMFVTLQVTDVVVFWVSVFVTSDETDVAAFWVT